MTTAPSEQRTAQRLTVSRTRCAQTCLRKHQLSYELRIRPDSDAKPLRMGSAIHLGRELVRKGETVEKAMELVSKSYDPFIDAAPDERKHDIEVEQRTVTVLLSGYFWRWAAWDKDMKVLETEWPFDIALKNPETDRPTPNFTLAGKVDGIIEEAGRVLVDEFKSTADDIEDPDADFWKVLRIDSQISTYYLAAESKGYHPEAIRYDVIRKPTTKPKQIQLLDDDGKKIVLDAEGNRVTKVNILKSGDEGKGHGDPIQSGNKDKGWFLQSRLETPIEYGDRLMADIGERPNRYYQRKEIARIDADIDEARYELWQMQRLIRECQLNERWPRSASKFTCLGFGRCAYFNLCTGDYDVKSGVTPEGFVKLNDPHPELAGD